MKRITLSALLMTLFLLLSCGSGSANVEDPKSKFLQSVISLSNDFLNVFAKTLGFKAETKKNDIGVYFTKIAETMTSVKDKLQKEVATNENDLKVKSAVDTLTEKLDKIKEGAETAASGAATGGVVGEIVKSNAAGNGPDAESIKSFVNGIKTIVGIVLKDGDGQADKTTSVDEDKKNIGKLFGAQNSGNDKGAEDKHVAAASASIGAVTGADILQAIAAANANAKDGKVSDAKDAAALALAKGTANENEDQLGDSAKKDAIIAGAIALRAMAKDGKFIVKDTAANKTEAESAKGVAASTVEKTLNTLTIAIRKTIDSGLNSINDALATKGATTPADKTDKKQ
ncbi:variable large protein (plasmid) [Candidatus Borrelia fainii]|uniref:Variable large protein n=1 Tax=Candidatus Borrelia fainii TaxID=2518322 RepID=A0ABN6UST7_9SPIR|nr:variable large family protein [Candidatus Borrelia fainii]BDU63439.1 variable large protein [Candidatus Borrelia fainii]